MWSLPLVQEALLLGRGPASCRLSIHRVQPRAAFLNDFEAYARTQANDPGLGERKTSRKRVGVKRLGSRLRPRPASRGSKRGREPRSGEGPPAMQARWRGAASLRTLLLVASRERRASGDSMAAFVLPTDALCHDRANGARGSRRRVCPRCLDRCAGRVGAHGTLRWSEKARGPADTLTEARRSRWWLGSEVAPLLSHGRALPYAAA